MAVVSVLLVPRLKALLLVGALVTACTGGDAAPPAPASSAPATSEPPAAPATAGPAPPSTRSPPSSTPPTTVPPTTSTTLPPQPVVESVAALAGRAVSVRFWDGSSF